MNTDLGSVLRAPRGRGDPLVEAELRRRIREQGMITFAEFMEVALYLLGGGYYEAHVAFGRSGDFLTSPEMHPVFGALMARMGWSMWQEIGAPKQFAVIEYGAGTGALCRQYLEAAAHIDGDFASAVDYRIVERRAFLRALQQATLMDMHDRVRWVRPEEVAEPAEGCVLANEVVDAFPVHRVRVADGKLKELYVGMEADEYVEVEAAPSTGELEAYLRRNGVWPPEGSVAEINLGAGEWLREAAGRLSRGYILTMDFGGRAEELYGRATPRGGLKCFWRHGWTDDPLDRPGLLDITAPVDFTNLEREGQAAGLVALVDAPQAEVLGALGMAQAMQAVMERGLRVEERERNLRAMRELVDANGLGGFRLLIQGKRAARFGFEAKEMAWAPVMEAQVMEWPE